MKKIFRHKRIDLGITQAEMAEKYGVSAAFLSGFELGKSVSDVLLLKIIESGDFDDSEQKEIIRIYIKRTGRLPVSLMSKSELDYISRNAAMGIVNERKRVKS